MADDDEYDEPEYLPSSEKTKSKRGRKPSIKVSENRKAIESQSSGEGMFKKPRADIISDSTSSFASSSLTTSESSVSFVYPNPNVEPKAYDLNKIFEETEGNVENIVEFFMKEFVDETKFLKLTKMINRENSFNRRKLHEKPNSIHPEQERIFQKIASTAFEDIAEEIESCDTFIAECIAEKKCLEILRAQLTGAIDTKRLNLMNKSFNKAIALKFVVVEEEKVE
jgi:hypothetical protein